MTQQDKNISIVVFGSGGTGKTAITVKFVNNHFVVDYGTLKTKINQTKCLFSLF